MARRYRLPHCSPACRDRDASALPRPGRAVTRSRRPLRDAPGAPGRPGRCARSGRPGSPGSDAHGSSPAQWLQRLPQIRRILRGEGDRTSGGGVGEGQLHRVQPLPGQAQTRGEGGIGTIERVTDQRVLQSRHVHADLMGATSLQDDAQQRRAAQLLDRLVVGDRVLAVLDDGELVVMVRGAPDRRLDRAGPLIRPSLADRVIDLLHGASTESVLERGVGTLRASDHHQTAGAHVQTLDDALPLRIAAGADRDTRRGQMTEHGGPGPPAAGMGGDPDGLVDHHEVVVLVHQRHALGDHRTDLGDRLLLGQLHAQHRAGLEAGGASRCGSADLDQTRVDQLGRAGAGQAQHPGDADIDTFTGQAVRDHQGAQRAHSRGSEPPRPRPGSPPSGPPGEGGEEVVGDEVCSSGPATADFVASAFSAASASATAGSAGTTMRPSSITRIAPPTTAIPATLKTGQLGSWRKSTTSPRNGPGGRSSRSWMFPSAPPRIRDIAIAYQVERTALTVKTTTPITMPSCRTVTAGVMPDPIPQAAPELYRRRSWRISPRKGCGWSSGRFASAQCLVIWSTISSSTPTATTTIRTTRRDRRRRAPGPWGPALVDSEPARFTDRSSPACPASRWYRDHAAGSPGSCADGCGSPARRSADPRSSCRGRPSVPRGRPEWSGTSPRPRRRRGGAPRSPR